MDDRWYKNAIIYEIDLRSFSDSDGDGIGDLRGLIGRLDYLAALGVTCIWLLPFSPSPWRDGGYDVSDHYGVHPELGTPGDLVELVHRASARGIRVVIDLVLNHTSDEHPWFQRAGDPDSQFRDHNLHDRPQKVRAGVEPTELSHPLELLGDRDYGDAAWDPFELPGYGYRWARIRGVA